MTEPNKVCETCWHWARIAHPFDFELGRCELFEREQLAGQVCGMWESCVSSAVSQSENQNKT